MEKYYLGIDNGGSVTKAALYNIKGEEIAKVQKDATVITNKKAYVERDLHDLIDSVKSSVIQVLKQAKLSGDDIAAISVSCHGKGLYLLGKDGRPAYNGIISSDSRASELVSDFKRDKVDALLYPITYQQLWTGHPAVLLKWLSIHNPKVLDATQYIFMGHDYIRYYLTGEAYAEISNISGSALVDVNKKEYSDKVLQVFELDAIKDKLPPIIESTDQSGAVTKQVAEETGLREGTPVYAGFFDVVAASISSGLVDSTEINATMGTWAIATCVTDSIVEHEYPYIWGNYCMPGKYFVHEGSPTSANNLGWFVQRLLGKEENIFDRCNNWVAQAQPDDALLYYPFLYSSNIKDNMPASLIGLRAHHEKRDIIRAVYEGIIFAHCTHLDRFFDLMPAVRKISVVGGPTKSAVWMQMLSDVTQRELVLPNCVEAGCKGVAMAAMVGSGEYSSFQEAVSHTVRATKTFTPAAEHADYYQQKYNRYNTLAKTLAQA